MSKIIEHYALAEPIGSGQYGKVYRARDLRDDSSVAVKVMRLERFKEIPKLQEFMMNEIHTLSKIENPHVVRFIEFIKTSNNVYLVY
jgi:serine/threonine protein kinase